MKASIYINNFSFFQYLHTRLRHFVIAKGIHVTTCNQHITAINLRVATNKSRFKSQSYQPIYYPLISQQNSDTQSEFIRSGQHCLLQIHVNGHSR